MNDSDEGKRYKRGEPGQFCKECAEQELHKTRGCRLRSGVPRKAKHGHLVWQDKEEDGGWRYELTECPISVLCRNDLPLKILRDWNSLGTLPIDYNKVPISLWLKVRALKEEQEWRANQMPPDKTDN